MHEHIRDAIHRLNRDADAASLHQPLNMARHREQLETAIDRGWDTYPGRFDYPHPAFDFDRDASAIEVAVEQEVRQPLRSAVLKYLANGRVSYRLALSRSDDEYSVQQREVNGIPSEALLSDARAILAAEPPAVSPADVPAAELQGRIRTALQNYGLDQWSVQLHENMAARVSVNGSLQRLRIRTGATFTRHDIDRLLVHEIGGHVLRWANAETQPEALAMVALGDNPNETEEGLAAALEGMFRLHDPAVLRTYACRVIAVHEAQTQGVISVARRLLDHVPVSQAVELALRVKRGLVDPNLPGGATKDYGYLAGLRRIEELPVDSLATLHSTKWALELLPLARQLVARGDMHAGNLTPNATQLGIRSHSA